MAIKKTCQRCRNKYDYGTTCSCSSQSRKEMKAIKNHDDKFYYSVAWKRLRNEIKSRDVHHCKRCLIKFGVINGRNLEVHHIVARSVNKAYELDPDNLVTVCKTCNLQLGTSGIDWDRSKEISRDMTPIL